MQSAEKVAPQPLFETSFARLASLARHPWALLLFLLALNAFVRPYGNITHDTRLYSVQVLNLVERGAYNNDLFFRYGSQDQFSLFSPVMAPLVALFGLELAFFLVYIVADVLLIAGMKKLVETLVPDRVISTLALMYLVTAPLNYGGVYTLHVHESFLTPRLLAVAAVVWGLDFLVQGRYGLALAVMILGAALHPLMAFGGILVLSGCWLVEKLGRKHAMIVFGSLALAVVVFLASPNLAGRYLGQMDESWRENIKFASPFNFTSEWETRDWVNVLWCWAALIGMAWTVRDSEPRLARLYGVVAAVGLAAVVGTFLATILPYALLLQGQPYRALWILKLLQVPLSFALIARLWQSGDLRQQAVALAWAGFFCTTSPLFFEWCMPLFFLPICLLAYRGLEVEPRRPDWLQRGVVLSLVLGGVSFCLYKESLLVGRLDQLLEMMDWGDVMQMLLINLGPLTCILGGLGVLALGTALCKSWTRFGLIIGGLGLAWQVACFAIPSTDFYRQHGTRYLPDVLFARDALPRTASGRHATVYCPFGRIEYVWLEMRSNCYFEWWQTGGFMFRRDTAMEGQRRAKLVAPFEMERFRRVFVFINERIDHDIRRMFGIGLDNPAPALADLQRLCQDPQIDYVVLKQEFPGLFSASNGRVFVYDCRQVCAALASAESAVAVVGEGQHREADVSLASSSPVHAKGSP